MSERLILRPRIFGNFCTVSHPTGCFANVREQAVRAAMAHPQKPGGTALVLGSSMGYGLSARLTAAFGYGMDTLGVALLRPTQRRRPAGAGWYNTAATHRLAAEAGLHAGTINGDCFSRETLEHTVQRVADELGPLDHLIYSVAAPRRVDPETGREYRSALKVLGDPVSCPTLDWRTGEIGSMEFEPATAEEVEGTVGVMGGEDLARWTRYLLRRGLLAEGARVVAFSYIGPSVTHAIYRDGCIGQAKQHLEATCRQLDEELQSAIGGSCNAVVAKSVVTQSSLAIPSITLYISLAMRIMKQQGVHEDTLDQMLRLFADHIGPQSAPHLDEEARIRIDDLEMRESVQQEVVSRWQKLESLNPEVDCDLPGFREDFLRIFGFGIKGVDYEEPQPLWVSLCEPPGRGTIGERTFYGSPQVDAR